MAGSTDKATHVDRLAELLLMNSSGLGRQAV